MKRPVIEFRNHDAEAKLFMRRALISLLIVFILTGVLIYNLYRLQVLSFEQYQTRSDVNRIKLVPIPPIRGLIYDRNGVPIAINRATYQLEIQPELVKNVDETIAQLREIIDITDEDVANFYKEKKRAKRFSFIALKSSISEEERSRFAVNQYKFEGVEIKVYQKRYYPYGDTLTHIIGYVSKISERDVTRLEADEKLANYAATNDIGKLGIERYYEDILHGTTGFEEVEVNSRGRVIRQLSEQTPKAGRDIYLTVDLKLQQYIQNLMEGSKGAIVVSDPRTGEILSMVSTPSYDANLFVNGISSKNFNELNQNPNKPFINRATQGEYPPASTVKPFIALSALAEGTISPTTTIFDPGWWQLPNSEKRYRDWKRWGHGKLDVEKSIIESADTFFYQLSFDMGINTLSKWMSRFGYGVKTGIDINEENSGVMPTREWKLKRHGKDWVQGDTIPVGIGQGYWTATPMQMSKVLNTLINNGEVKTPHFLLRTQQNSISENYHQVEESQLKNIDPLFWKLVKRGMHGVAHAKNGTAHKFFKDAEYELGVKTGTAQVYSYEVDRGDKTPVHLRDHRLMIAFAPFDNPTISVAMILENGGKGSPIGEIMRNIMDFYLLGEKNELEEVTEETIREEQATD